MVQISKTKDLEKATKYNLIQN